MENNNNDQPQPEEKLNETLVKENIEQPRDEEKSSEENVQETVVEESIVEQTDIVLLENDLTSIVEKVQVLKLLVKKVLKIDHN